MIAVSRACRMPHRHAVRCIARARDQCPQAVALRLRATQQGTRHPRHGPAHLTCEGRSMALPIPFDYVPMNARLVDAIPPTGQWQYEPKWDGFRCLAFRDGTRVELRSKSGQPLGRYFPEL